jgi:signal transduction histidine kinase
MDGRAGDLPERRTLREWAVDGVLFCAAVLLGLVALGVIHEQQAPPPWVEDLDPILGLLACCALWWCRRFPRAVALLGVPAVALASSALPAGALIIANLGLRVPWRRAMPVFGLHVATAVPSGVLLSGADGEVWFDMVFALTYLLAAFSIGYALRSRRMLVQRLRADAERERTEHAHRLADARRAERQAIAREMHDVLAHRISLLSVHAGALAYRYRRAQSGSGPALSGAEVVESAEVIRGNAHAAVEELQEVLNLLRGEADETEPTSLLPRIADIDRLVADARAAGQVVDYRNDLDDEAIGDLRAQLHRTVYRIVQEGLTNARKHGPGTPVTVRLAGAPGAPLTVELRNVLPEASAGGTGVPGAGAGLAGLAERVRLEGGTLERGVAGNAFTLRAQLPLPSR